MVGKRRVGDPATANATQAATAVQFENDENKERGNWTNKFDFFLSAVGYAVGLGNLWRFPFRAYQNGGASFLVPYTVTLLLAGLPLFFLEMSLGQFCSLGPITLWKMIPIFKGLGWAMLVLSVLCSIYYNMIIAYVLYYLFASFTSELPWSTCRPEWTQYGCYDRVHSTNNTMQGNLTVVDEQWRCGGERGGGGGDGELGGSESRDSNTKGNNSLATTYFITNCSNVIKRKTPSEIYWEREVLDMSEGIGEGASDIKWDLALCLLLAWILVFLCLCKGIKSSGKVVYFTALFPYVVLVILLFWNVQLEGAWTGIKFYIVPKWEKILSAKVWYAAGTQIFYSLGVAFGSLQTMASYNKFHNNVYRDAVLVAFINCGTSVFAGFVIFSVIGFMSTMTGLPVDEVVAGGPGLVFIAYPEGLAMMPVAPLWSILFFLMLFTLGIDSQFAMMEMIITAVCDEFPVQFTRGRRRMLFIAACCTAMFFAGLPQCSRAGIYVFTLFDWYSCGLNLVIIGLVEILVISFIYGFRRLSDDIMLMIGHKPNYYWIICWVALTPLMMAFILVFSIIDTSPASYADYIFPDWANNIGWAMFAAPLSAIPLIAIYQCYKVFKLRKSWRALFQPAADWGPALEQFRTGAYDSSLSSANHRPPSEDISKRSVHSHGSSTNDVTYYSAGYSINKNKNKSVGLVINEYDNNGYVSAEKYIA